MYPLLELDIARRKWIADTTRALSSLADAARVDLDEAERMCRFPRDVYRQLGTSGLLAPMVPVEYGGMGHGVAEYCVIAEEVGRRGLVSGQIAAQGQRWLLDWGTDEQKEQWLGGIASGELVFSESISEKNAGSSFKAMQSTARRDGTDWVLNGQKTHVNLGPDSDVTLFFAIAEEGLTSYLVPMDAPGVTTIRTDPVGLRLLPTGDVSLDEVRVPAGSVLGLVGGGLKTFLSTFNVSRLGNASELIGLGRRCVELGIEYAEKRKVGSKFVTEFQGIQWAVADSWQALQAASLGRDYASLLHAAGDDIALATSAAKRMAIDAAELSSNSSFSLVGGHGLYHDQPYMSILNDIKVLKVAGGSSEVLRNHIAARTLKDPVHEGIA